MSRACRLAVLGGLLGLEVAGCARRRPPPPPPPSPRYLLGPAWQSGDVWFYPAEHFNYDQTGIASVISAGHAVLTADDELYDPNAMAAAMQAVQLPAIATVTNLENGLQLEVRVNDRGPDDPGRLIALSPRAALLLRMGSAARVRVQFDADRSLALQRQLQGHAGDLQIAAAPRGDVRQSDLAPLAGSAVGSGRVVHEQQAIQAAPEHTGPVVPLRLPEQLAQGAPEPGTLMIDAGSFTHEVSARRRAAILSADGGRLISSRSGGQTSYQVVCGPYADVAQADSALRAMIRDGATDARIVVDLR